MRVRPVSITAICWLTFVFAPIALAGLVISFFSPSTIQPPVGSAISYNVQLAYLGASSIMYLACAVAMWRGKNIGRLGYMAVAAVYVLYSWAEMGLLAASAALLAIPLQGYYLFMPEANAFFKSTAPIVSGDKGMTFDQLARRALRICLYAIGASQIAIADSSFSVSRMDEKVFSLSDKYAFACTTWAVGIVAIIIALALKRFEKAYQTAGHILLISAWFSASSALSLPYLTAHQVLEGKMPVIETDYVLWGAIVVAQVLLAFTLIHDTTAKVPAR